MTKTTVKRPSKEIISTAKALAVHTDTWAGDVVATLQAFTTTRKGERVKLLRWSWNGMPIGGSKTFSTVDRACAVMSAHPYTKAVKPL